MTAATPHGLRRMNASFSAISEASTSPIGMRPVPKTYWIMCRPSTTSARHSVTTLPHSRAMRRARLSVSRLTIWARLSNSSARWMRLVRRQAGKRRAGGGDGFLGVGRPAEREDADDFLLRGRAAALEAISGRGLPAAGKIVSSEKGSGGSHSSCLEGERRPAVPVRSERLDKAAIGRRKEIILHSRKCLNHGLGGSRTSPKGSAAVRASGARAETLSVPNRAV